ncbi:MAG: hypothetical protein AAF483_07980 [Planctomycetota bacterium]
MRQLTVLGVGLVLITFWGIGLRSYLRNRDAQRAATAQTRTAQDENRLPAAPNEPQPLIASDAARPLTTSHDSGAQNVIDLSYNESPQSQVRPASFAAPPLPKTVTILEVREIEANGDTWIWPNPETQLLNSTIWMRNDSNKLEFDVKIANAAPGTTVIGGKLGATNAEKTTIKVDNALLKEAKDAKKRFHLNVINDDSKIEIKKVNSPGQIRLSFPNDRFPPRLDGVTTNENSPEIPRPVPELKLLGKDPSGSLNLNQYAFDYNVFLQNTAPYAIALHGEHDDTSKTFRILDDAVQSVRGRSVSISQRVTVALGKKSRTYFLSDDEQTHSLTKTPLRMIGVEDVNAAFKTIAGAPTPAERTKFASNRGQTITATVDISNVGSQAGLTATLHDKITNRTILGPVAMSAKTAPEFEAIFPVENVPGATYNIEPRFFLHGVQISGSSKEKEIEVRNGLFQVTSVGPTTFGKVQGVNNLEIVFNRLPAGGTWDGDASTVASAVFGKNKPVELEYSANGRFTDTSTDGTAGFTATWSPEKRTLTLNKNPALLGRYRLTINTANTKDEFGNPLEGNKGEQNLYVKLLGGIAGTVNEFDRLTPTESNVVTRGVQQNNAPFVEFPEFVEPIKKPDNFNPHDKVEARVARLYFFRDAHHVAQILNRRVQSYNRQEVSMRRRIADDARQKADSMTTQRMDLEREAYNLAQKARRLENELSDTQRELNTAVQQAAAAQATDDGSASQIALMVEKLADQAESLESQVNDAREDATAANDRWTKSEREEQIAREDQFRLETAAAHADPVTYAAGDPKSIDPVAQVSISVIGEGLIHLRGPLKGVNKLRTMIDQIDSPQGQVRVNVHSTQINGDEADHLEVVANRIQTYIDQARFLTVQSAEMLRKSVVHVASARAEQARTMYLGATQAERDQLYLHAFFGRDFIDELRAMDSELLHTGNKLLSLHSMDVTSLSSALMLLALANNETRAAILNEFERLVQTELTVAEQQYINNSMGCCTGGCKLGCKHCKHGPPVCLFAQNGTFTSLRGFFDADIAHSDTMSPLQREVIRLAQIMKARLITEMEYKQRVMERAVIEQELQNSGLASRQLANEREALNKLQDAKKRIIEARAEVIPNLANTLAVIKAGDTVVDDAGASLKLVLDAIQSILGKDASYAPLEINDENELQTANVLLRAALDLVNKHITSHSKHVLSKNSKSSFRTQIVDAQAPGARVILFAECVNGLIADQAGGNLALMLPAQNRDQFLYAISSLQSKLSALKTSALELRNANSSTPTNLDKAIKALGNLLDESSKLQSSIREINDPTLAGAQEGLTVGNLYRLKEALTTVQDLVVLLGKRKSLSTKLKCDYQNMVEYFNQLGNGKSEDQQVLSRIIDLYQIWVNVKNDIEATYDSAKSAAGPGNRSEELDEWIEKTSEAMKNWLDAVSELEATQSIAQNSRLPLDHKKFMDMFIDQMEEKHIELLEGTRAHTANIDNYLKRLTTSLDDDFNTQFYYPAFRLIREASQYRRVEFGQTETTNVLVNNRQLGKVSPSATMEFDLPERDILLAEGVDAAMAIYNDVGALVNDPNMLGLIKAQGSGSPSLPSAGSLGGRAAVRSVLPGLQGETAEQLMAQNAGSGPDFESNVEKLIPDPAVYKFETGTGYEIRPVIAPDGQAVVFDFHYLYKTQIREPVKADEKHLGRIRQHFIDTDVQLSNFELREVSRYTVALKAERTANGVPLLEDIPLIGVLWRPLPNREKSLQQNIVMAQATIFPTLFDLMGLRWAPTVSDLDPLQISNREYLVRGRNRFLQNWIYDISSSRVDNHLEVPEASRRSDLYRSQATIPSVHPNGYRGRGLDFENSRMREGYDPEEAYVNPGMIPARSADGALYLPHRQNNPYNQMPRGVSLIEEVRPTDLTPPTLRPHVQGQQQTQGLIQEQLPTPSNLPQEYPTYPQHIPPTIQGPQVYESPASQGNWENAVQPYQP